MPAQIDGQVLLVEQNSALVALFAGLGQLREGFVGAPDVGGVVLAMVKFVDLTRDMRLECPAWS